MSILFKDSTKRVEIISSREGRVNFNRREDAAIYLRHYLIKNEAGLRLRSILNRNRHLHVNLLSDTELINAVSNLLLDGTLQLLEFLEPRIEALSLLEESQEAEEMTEVLPPPSPTSLLLLLEELQIETAEVMPEIMQALEQLNITMEGIGMASTSLEPAPSRIPRIIAAVVESSNAVSQILSAL